jgi:hypothetical protein
VAAFAQTDGGGEEDDPNLAEAGQLFGPGGGLVEHVPSYDLPEDSHRQHGEERYDGDLDRSTDRPQNPVSCSSRQ